MTAAKPRGSRSGLKRFLVSAFSRPGAVALAMVALYAGVAGLFHIGASTDALAALMPMWLSFALNLIYAAAGIAMLVGMGRQRGNIEAAGWILLAASVLVRAIAIVVVAGLTPSVLGLLVLYVGFLSAAIVRIVQIVRGDAIVVVHVVKAGD